MHRRIGLTYDLKAAAPAYARVRAAEFDTPETVAGIEAALVEGGDTVVRLGHAQQLWHARASLDDVDLVFNIAEGWQGRCREAWVPSVLDLAGRPYVGSSPTTLAVALDKAATKRLLMASGIPTPRFVEAGSAAELDGLADVLPPYPLIVKPRYEGSGLGVDRGAVVTNRAALLHRVEQMLEQFQEPVVVEEFIAGGECTVCLIGNRPPAVYPPFQRALDAASGLSNHVVPEAEALTTPLEFTEELERSIMGLALRSFELLRCRDVARVDVRVDVEGRPWVLEVNPLPALAESDSFGQLARYLGVPYAQIIQRIVDVAWDRVTAHGR